MNENPVQHVIVVGGGAAGFFGAIACAQQRPGQRVTILERGPQFLQKVKISGGGRCNVTHACFEPKALVTRFPRGSQELIGAFHRFAAADTVQWFEARGVTLKTEPDGRMFPVTDNSQTVIDCLRREARAAGIDCVANCGVEALERPARGGFRLRLNRGDPIECERLLLATGGCRALAGGALAVSLGHTLEPPVPSLFTFHVSDPRLAGLAGLAVEFASVSIPGTKLLEAGPLLVTHWGLSGPAILRLSAWGARELARMNYQFTVRINWMGDLAPRVAEQLQLIRRDSGARLVRNVAFREMPARLWERLVAAAGIGASVRWSTLTKPQAQSLARQLTEADFQVAGKSLNKDEFVTCGGVRLSEVDFKTMQSRVCPGLYFAGELLDIDGITGGFNFQAAWTTGRIAGRAMAEAQHRS